MIKSREVLDLSNHITANVGSGQRCHQIHRARSRQSGNGSCHRPCIHGHQEHGGLRHLGRLFQDQAEYPQVPRQIGRFRSIVDYGNRTVELLYESRVREPFMSREPANTSETGNATPFLRFLWRHSDGVQANGHLTGLKWDEFGTATKDFVLSGR